MRVSRPLRYWLLAQLIWETIVAAVVPAVPVAGWAELPPGLMAYWTDSPRQRPKQAAVAQNLIARLNA